MSDDYQEQTQDNAASDLGATVGYADSKHGVVIGYVPPVPETDSVREEYLWKELINRMVMDEHDEISLDGPIADPRYVVERETGATTVFDADELAESSGVDGRNDFEIDDGPN